MPFGIDQHAVGHCKRVLCWESQMQGWMIGGRPCLEAVACSGAIGGRDAGAAIAAVHGAVVLGD